MLTVYFAFRGKVVGSDELSFRHKSAVFLLLCLTTQHYYLKVTHCEIKVIMKSYLLYLSS